MQNIFLEREIQNDDRQHRKHERGEDATTTVDPRRTDSATKIIYAPTTKVYEAFIDPDALVEWLPPEGMTGRIDIFQAWAGGSYQMTLTYTDSDYATGKTSDNSDVVNAKFLELTENERIVQQIEFESDDPAFAGTMLMSWHLRDVPEGTEIRVVCENVPEGIGQAEHEEGLRSTLANLADFVE